MCDELNLTESIDFKDFMMVDYNIKNNTVDIESNIINNIKSNNINNIKSNNVNNIESNNIKSNNVNYVELTKELNNNKNIKKKLIKNDSFK